MDSNLRLRIATRIHFAMLRLLGDSVEVQDILHRPAQTREVLWVCEGSGDEELIALAAQFRQASLPDAATPAAVTAAQTAAPIEPSAKRREHAPVTSPDTSWGRDTSGFGVSHPPDIRSTRPDTETQDRKPGPRRERDWLKPSTWLRTR